LGVNPKRDSHEESVLVLVGSFVTLSWMVAALSYFFKASNILLRLTCAARTLPYLEKGIFARASLYNGNSTETPSLPWRSQRAIACTFLGHVASYKTPPFMVAQ
jgi:hypothetical protein